MQLRHKFFISLSLLTAIPLLILLFGVVERMEKEVMDRTGQELHGTLDKIADELNADPKFPELAYTTILTVTRNLVKRKYVAQTKDCGRKHKFESVVDKSWYKQELMRTVLEDAFENDMGDAMRYLKAC